MMMKEACLVLILAMSPAALFAGETMVKRTTYTTRTTTKCDFRVDKCQTSVATDSPYVRFKDGPLPLPPAGSSSASGDPSYYQSTFAFVDYNFSPQPTIEELVALIRNKLSNCPEVTVNYDNDSGDITVHYLKSACGSDCDWVVNVRDVKADDFVWTRTADNYSPYLGQMERRKFHCTSEKDAQTIESACAQICKINAWTPYE
jgi:hypothetical protein